MRAPERYSSSDPIIQEHFAWVKNQSVPGLIDPIDGIEVPFLPEKALLERLTPSGYNGRGTALLGVVFSGKDVPVAMSDIVPKYAKVFSILLETGDADWIEHFLPHDSLSDVCLPFNEKSPPQLFPKDPRNDQLLAEFCRAQWRFCAPKLDGTNKKIFEEHRILPITSCTRIGRGGSANIFKVEIHPDYNELRLSEPSDNPLDYRSTDTFVLKTYYGRHALSTYNSEGGAFFKLGKHASGSLIGYHGSYVHGDRVNVILEHADQGCLEDYFKSRPTPPTGLDMINFWEQLFKVLEALTRIHHGQNPTNNTLRHGWHQDVKPANILVTSLGETIRSPYQYRFKLADLGLSHFKTEASPSGEAVAPDTQGTKTYGAPEAFRANKFEREIDIDVTPKVDVWSVGCIFTEAAVWAYYSYSGLQEYRVARRAATSEIAAFDDEDCFHDGERRLGIVRQWQDKVLEELRANDFVTGEVLEMVENMLDDNLSTRHNAAQCWKASQSIIKKARDKYSSSSRTRADSIQRKKMRVTASISPESHQPDLNLVDASRGLHNSNGGYIPGNLLFPNAHYAQSPDSMSLSPDQGQPSPRRQPGRFNSEESQTQHDQRRISQDQGYLATGIGAQPRELNRADYFVNGPAPDHTSESNYHTIPRSTYNPRRRSESRSISGFVRPPSQYMIPGHSYDNQLPSRREIITANQAHDCTNWQPSGAMNPSYDTSVNEKLARHNNNHVGISPQLSPRSEGPSSQRISGLSPPSKRLDEQDGGSSNGPLRGEMEPSSSLPKQKMPRLTLAVANKWKDDIKKTKNMFKIRQAPPSLPDAWLLHRLAQRDHIFIIDDALSMSNYWKEVESLFEILAYIVKKEDPDGLDVHFTMSCNNYHSKKSSFLVQKVKDTRPQGTSDIQLVLDRIIRSYTGKLERQKLVQQLWHGSEKEVSPLNIYVFTDGVWQERTSAVKAIKKAVDVLVELGFDEKQLGIQFIRFGNDPTGRLRLDELDDNLNLPLDIVDTTPSTGNNIWKMLLGAIDKDFDADD